MSYWQTLVLPKSACWRLTFVSYRPKRQVSTTFFISWQIKRRPNDISVGWNNNILFILQEKQGQYGMAVWHYDKLAGKCKNIVIQKIWQKTYDRPWLVLALNINLAIFVQNMQQKRPPCLCWFHFGLQFVLFPFSRARIVEVLKLLFYFHFVFCLPCFIWRLTLLNFNGDCVWPVGLEQVHVRGNTSNIIIINNNNNKSQQQQHQHQHHFESHPEQLWWWLWQCLTDGWNKSSCPQSWDQPKIKKNWNWNWDQPKIIYWCF